MTEEHPPTAAGEPTTNRPHGEVVFEVDDDGRITRVHGDPGDLAPDEDDPDLTGVVFWEAVPAFATPAVETACRRAIDDGRPATASDDGLARPVRAYPCGSGATVVVGPPDGPEDRDGAGPNGSSDGAVTLQEVFENCPAGIVVLDRDGEVIRANERVVERFGIEVPAGDGTGNENGTGSDAPGQCDVYDVDGEYVPPGERPFAEVVETGEPVSDRTCSIELSDGTRRRVSIDASPIRGDDGDVERVVVTVEESTGAQGGVETRVKGETEPVAELSNVLERMTDAVFALDTEWRFTYLNDRAEELIERDRADLLGESVWDAFPGTVDSEFEERYRHAMATQEPVQFESYYPPLETWFDVRAYPDESGLSVYFRNVTERKEREHELQRYETIVEAIDDGVYVVDEDGQFLMVNQRYAEMTGYDREELVGNHVSMVVSEEVVARAEEIDRRMREGETDTATIEAQLRTADGTIPAEATFALLESGGEEYRVSVVRDVSQRKRREAELERQRENLELLIDVNDVVQRISREALAAESREEVEAVVCEGLVDSEHYQAAWIGEVDGDRINLRTGAGTDDLRSLVDVNVGVAGGSPVELAHRRDSVQVRQNVQSDPRDPRSELFGELDFRSSLSTPIVYDGRSFGVLTIDSERAYAFGGIERDVIERMARTVANAISTVEHRQRYRSLVDDVLDRAAPVGITVVDEDGTVAWTNEAFESYFGLDPGEAHGRDGATFVDDRLKPGVADPETFVERLRRARDPANVPLRSEIHVEAGEDRGERYLEHVAVPVETGLYAGGWVDIYSDVTELRASERARNERERMWSTLISNLPGMVYRCRTDPGWPMEFVSEDSRALCGYDPEALEEGRVSWGNDVIHPDDAGPLRERILEAVEADEPFREIYRIRTSEDELRWVWEQGRPIRSGGTTYLEGFITDVTERQWAQRERDLARELLGATATARTLDEALTATVDRICAETEWTAGEAWTLDGDDVDVDADAADGRLRLSAVSEGVPDGFVEVSEAVSFAPGEGLVGRVYETGASEYLPDLTAGEADYRRAEAAAEAGLTVAAGVPVVTDGDVVAVLVFYADERRAVSDRLVEAVTTIGRQIGEVVGRKRAEASLRESERRFRSLVQEVEDYAIFMLDADGYVRTWNEGAERIKGYEAEEIIGEHYGTFYTEEDVEAGRPAENLERAAETGRAEDEGWRVRKDGSKFWANAILTAVHDDEGGIEGFAKVTRDMTDRREWEQELERLSRINGVIRRITQALVRAESNEEIEQAVCGLLAETDPYVFAWYGEVGSGDDRIEPRTWAGREEGYLSAIEMTTDESETGLGPAGRAIREDRVVVCEDVASDESFAPWREEALERGYRSTVAVPVSYGEAQYGVLGIYAGSPEPLSEDERAVLAELGETIGHAKNSMFRRQGLVADAATQLTFTFETGLFEGVELSENSLSGEASLTFEDTISVGDGQLVHYVTAENFSEESLETFVGESSSIDSYRRIGDEDADTYELHQSQSALLELLGDYGGRLREFAIEATGDGSSVVVELPPDVDVREFVADVQATYPGAELEAQRVVNREDPTGWEFRHAVVDELTDKQHEALEAAFYGGYFEWPRESDGESIAEVLGVSPSTFHQHLRVGERKMLAALFAG